MLLAILLILLQTGTTDSQISLTTEFSERRQIFLWIASFASFAVKVPMVPVHIWLPEAHVKAPTAESVILAGIPLKLGTHGFLRFSIPMFPKATLRSTPFIYTPRAIAIIYTSSTTSRQIDLKKIIAYSPVAHMNLVTIEAESKRKLTRKLEEPFSARESREGEKRLVVEAVASGTKPSLKDRLGAVRHSGLEGGKQMKGGITGRLQEAKLRRLDKSLIECKLLSEDFELSLIREGGREVKLSELYKADHYISRWRRKLFELPFIRFTGAAQHIAGSQRARTTCLTLRSEGP
ncbi:hypothetical protein VitviT2T_015788 [Vitis vinifera]|uniref:NADH-ubiquinone oxidoreductase chain 4 n=1 Tax=Vitis vinifera TaxID=29760 RepID=A0ABY9CPH7_VITVI|nr:hypothetical protein VitviT2T_015788 [Vitis vinifera]